MFTTLVARKYLQKPCLSESVTHIHSVNHFTGHNLPPIFAKLATEVESQDIWRVVTYSFIHSFICFRQQGP